MFRSLIAVALSCVACTTRQEQPKVYTSVETLSRIAAMPYPPVRAQLEVFDRGINSRMSAPGPSDTMLYAYFTLTDEDAEKLVASSTVVEGQASIEDRSWYPPELREYLQAQEGSRKLRVLGTSLDPKRFEKMPYRAGVLVRLGKSPNFFLTMFTM
jgi:hypothetical protein